MFFAGILQVSAMIRLPALIPASIDAGMADGSPGIVP